MKSLKEEQANRDVVYTKIEPQAEETVSYINSYIHT